MLVDRRDIIRKGISKSQRGLEIAPFFAPIVPKAEGYNVEILDVFDTQRLREIAAADPNIPNVDLLEEVDHVGNAVDLADIVDGQFDYVISSHNFEHLPDPIRFLQGVERVLKPGGLLSMAIPDRRLTFDFFRPYTLLGEWLEAFHEQRKRPNPRQVFAERAYFASHPGLAFRGARHAKLEGNLQQAWDNWGAGAYEDVHCTIVTPSVLHLLLLECKTLDLFSLGIEDVSPPNGIEFYVRLRKSIGEIESVGETREELLRRIKLEEKELVTVLSPRVWKPKILRLLSKIRNFVGHLKLN